MANPIIRGFRSLTVFSGRDRRGQFWPYAGVVVVLTYLLAGVGGALIMNSIMAELPLAMADGGTGQTFMPDFTAFFLVMAATFALAIILLAAAVSRRLHDTGKSALFGLMPIPFIVISCTFFPIMMRTVTEAAEPNLALFFLTFISNILYMVALITLIVLLCFKGANGPNRFGNEPV